jgi:hypothetical protein
VFRAEARPRRFIGDAELAATFKEIIFHLSFAVCEDAQRQQ